MNPTQIYQGLIQLDKTPKDTRVEEESAKNANLAAWSDWRRIPQTQLLIKILEQKLDEILRNAMASAKVQNNQMSLVEAETIQKILNKVMIDGTYE